jgi:uncharacterized protein (UPF0332 family)
MDSEVRLFLQRAENELRLAKAVFNLSKNSSIKAELGANEGDTFYSAAISHSYYAIFYAAKALLTTRRIKTAAPDIHKRTFEEFNKNFVESGILDVELIKIYKKMIVRADELLGLFRSEKWKRGHFTYHTIAQANIPPAEESMKNAVMFLKHIKVVLEK